MAEENNPFLGPQIENPFVGLQDISSQLASARLDQAKQLEDPQTALELYKLTHNEVGTQGLEAQQAFIESVFNRAKARGQTISEAVNDKNYYPSASYRDVKLHGAIDTSEYQDALNNVLKGGNISGFATGNASGTVGFNRGVQTAAFGGERFGIEGPDLKGEVKDVTNPFIGVAGGGSEIQLPETMDTGAEAELAAKIGNEHPVFKNALDAASEVVTGMIPKNPYELAKILLPPVLAFDQTFRGTIGGQGADIWKEVPLLGRIPDIIEAERTPPGSKERFATGFRTIGDILLIAGLGKAAGLKPKVAAQPEIISTQEIPGAPAFANPPIAAGEFEPINPVRGSGKFRKSYQVDKELGDMMEGIGASLESGGLRANTAALRMLSELNPEQEAAFGRYLVSRRLKTVNPEHPQILPDSELTLIETDPSIAKAIKTYVEEVKPEIEALRKRAGLSEEAAAGKEPEFISLIPTSEELLPQAAQVVTRASRLSRTTKFAREAKGYAKEYSTNLEDILRESYGEAMRKARIADFYKAVKRKGLSDTERFEDLPVELQHDLRAATETKLQPSGMLKGVRAVQRAATSAALTANPAELMNHMRRQLHLLAAKPPIGRGLIARLEALIPYIGPRGGAFIRSVVDDMSTVENRAILQDIFDAGGGSSRSFSQMYALRGKLSKYTGLQWLQRKTHNLLFGIPEGRGVKGWDLRMRVQLEKIRRSAEGNTDPQRIREFANQIGQYGSHPDWIIGALREINPYAATTLPMRLTELKSSVGISGLKSAGAKRALRAAETQLRGTGGTILALATANYLMSGKWPWENDPGHEFDLNTGMTGDDGKRIYTRFRVISPELFRPVSTVGIPNLARERTADTPQYAAAVMTALANQGLSIVGGPAQNALLTATTGTVPYLVRSPGEKGAPHLLDVAKTAPGESRGLEQLKRAGASLNPLGESLVEPRYEPELPPVLQFLERPLFGSRAVRPFGSMFTESYEKKPPKRRPTLSQIRARARKKAMAEMERK